jgi:hypothetical protein
VAALEKDAAAFTLTCPKFKIKHTPHLKSIPKSLRKVRQSKQSAVLDPRAYEMMDDPKFKKGTKMKALSPQSQKLMADIRTLRARENSTSWHTRFASKGVEKDDSAKDGSEAGPDAGEPCEGNSADNAAAAPHSEGNNADNPAAAPGESSETILTLKDARVPGLHLNLNLFSLLNLLFLDCILCSEMF